ncbi:MAG: orotate phosphoribosyltransferase [Candidatus Omnitrophota bacterium]
MSKGKAGQDKKKLLQLLKRKAFKKGKIILSSGKSSNYYLDGRLVTLNSQGAYLLANILFDLIKKKGATAIGGPTIGADPIVGAVINLAAIKRKKLNGFIVRKAAKGHGMRRLIEGPQLFAGTRVILVDDVATTGTSLVEAKRILDKQRVQVICAVVIFDREEGAAENLAKAGCPLISIFKKDDLLK